MAIKSSHLGLFTVHRTIDGAKDAARETNTASKCKIEIPLPAPVISATVTLIYPAGLQVSQTVNVPAITQQDAALRESLCKYRHLRFRPIPWWQ